MLSEVINLTLPTIMYLWILLFYDSFSGQMSENSKQMGLNCYLVFAALVNLKTLDLSDSEVENAGLRFLTGKSLS